MNGIGQEGRVNALRQLLNNTQADVIKAYEGDITPAEYEALRTIRQAWKNELAELLGEPAEEDEVNRAPDVLLTTITNHQELSEVRNALETAMEGLT